MAASSPHPHPLHLVQYDRHNKWRCNMCFKRYSVTDSTGRYRCNSCVNFDACSRCSHRHPHPLVAVTSPTSWFCDSCKSSFGQYSSRYRCDTCTDYDRCQSCYSTRPHPHSLKLVTYGSNWDWRCDGCHVVSRGSKDRSVRHRCQICPDFDFCDRCNRSTPHQHPLKRIESKVWICDECRTANGSKRYRCGTCYDYDRCENCHNKATRPGPSGTLVDHFVSSRHSHPLKLVTYGNGGAWCCDHCNATFYGYNDAPRYRCGSCVDYDLCQKCWTNTSHYHPLKKVSSPSSWFCDSCRVSLNWSQPRYRCALCNDYDVCFLCYEGQSTPSHPVAPPSLLSISPSPPVPSPTPVLSNPSGSLIQGFANLEVSRSQAAPQSAPQPEPEPEPEPSAPVQTIVDVIIEPSAPPSPPSTPSLDDQLICCICMENVKTIAFVPCGHMCCCTVCSAAVKKCPMCRVRIDKHLKIYM